MTATYSVKPVEELSDAERDGLGEMKTAVYPPEQFADSPGRRREWLRPEWCVLVGADGEVVSYTGIVMTEAEVDRRPVTIGGVGGIATHPEHRGRGHAARSIEAATRWMADQGVEFALLVCRDELVAYYGRLGWAVFEGRLVVTQFGERETFTFNRVMVKGVCGETPAKGTIELAGPPW